MPVVAAVLPAVIGAGVSIYGANQQANAAKDAARASSKATQQSLALQEKMYNQNRADQEPWRLAGVGALGRLQNPLASFQASPDYNFRMSEGLKGVNQNFATAGLLKSGAALRGISDYAQQTAAGEFGDWWNRQSGLAGLGQTANASNQQAGQAYANNAQNALMTNAQNLGSSYYQQANAWSQGVGGLGGALAWGLNNLPYGGGGKIQNKGF